MSVSRLLSHLLTPALLLLLPLVGVAQPPPCIDVPPGSRVILEEELIEEPCPPAVAVPVHPGPHPSHVRRVVHAEPERAQWFWGVGVNVGTVLDGHGGVYYGGGFKVGWEPGARLRLESDLHILGRPGDGLLVDWTLGASWAITSWAITPIVGGGFGFMYQELEMMDHDIGERRMVDDAGFGIYVSAGFEALRTTRTRLILDVRFDVPTFHSGTLDQQRWVPSVRSNLAFLW